MLTFYNLFFQNSQTKQHDKMTKKYIFLCGSEVRISSELHGSCLINAYKNKIKEKGSQN